MDVAAMLAVQAPAPGRATGNATGTTGSPPDARRARAEKMASDFESVFLANYLKSMFEGVGENEITGGGTGTESWKELLVDEYANSFAARGGIGLAEPITRQLLQIQEANPQ